jgi:hypothetical protein
MNQGRTIFAQLMDCFLAQYAFGQIVDRHHGDHGTRTLSCLDQFRALAFAQLTGRESLRDIQNCLSAFEDKLYHAGFRGPVSRSTLADANERRPWQLWAEVTLALVAIARPLYAGEDFGVELEQTAYALDSSTVDLCLTLFPWARFRKTKAGIKLHTLLDLRGQIPAFLVITDARVHDVNLMDEICNEAGAVYIVDRGYLDFARLWRIKQRQAFFVTRAKSNTQARRVCSREVDKATGLVCDQTVVLTGASSRRDYPEPLRRIAYIDRKTGHRYVFLTNHFGLDALSVAKLYKARWGVELFFKWIKQHLRVKAFYGRSENAVKTQIWIGIGVYVLVAIVKKRLHLEARPYTILQVLGLTLFEKIPIKQALSGARDDEFDSISNTMGPKQLELFDF